MGVKFLGIKPKNPLTKQRQLSFYYSNPETYHTFGLNLENDPHHYKDTRFLRTKKHLHRNYFRQKLISEHKL